jgi:hypothetical protein
LVDLLLVLLKILKAAFILGKLLEIPFLDVSVSHSLPILSLKETDLGHLCHDLLWFPVVLIEE